jgi:hypothetical protein
MWGGLCMSGCLCRLASFISETASRVWNKFVSVGISIALYRCYIKLFCLRGVQKKLSVSQHMHHRTKYLLTGIAYNSHLSKILNIYLKLFLCSLYFVKYDEKYLVCSVISRSFAPHHVHWLWLSRLHSNPQLQPEKYCVKETGTGK